MSLRSVSFASLLILLVIGPAGAAQFHHEEAPFVAVHHCTCRDGGQEAELGEHRCLKTADGPKSAICVTEQNVTSWRTNGETCPLASLIRPPG